MIDTTGTAFCEVCGLATVGGACPDCDKLPKLSKRAQLVAEQNRVATDRRLARHAMLTGRPRWQQACLRAFWWLTA